MEAIHELPVNILCIVMFFSGFGEVAMIALAVDDIAVPQGLVVEAVVSLPVSPLKVMFSVSWGCLPEPFGLQPMT